MKETQKPTLNVNTSDCPQWDHVVQLRACCLGDLAGGDGGGKRGSGFLENVPQAPTCNAQRGFEVGRWITSFGRGVGHWVHDISL